MRTRPLPGYTENVDEGLGSIMTNVSVLRGEPYRFKREGRLIAVRGRMALLEQSDKRGKEYGWIADLQ